MNDIENTSGVAEFSRSTWSRRGSLKDIVTELQRQKESRVDFTCDLRAVSTVVEGGGVKLVPIGVAERELLESGGTPLMLQAVRQLCERLEPAVPAKFFDALADKRSTRAQALLDGLMIDTGGRVFVRVLDKKVRAVLSNRYRVLDHYDVAFTAMDTAKKHNAEIIEANLTDRSMRIKMISRELFDVLDSRRSADGNWYIGGLGNQKMLNRVAARTEGDLPGGPGTVWPAVTISNSETGHGGLNVRFGILAGICFNLATVEAASVTVHLGTAMEAGVWSEKTRSLESQTIYNKASDAIAAAFNKATFDRIMSTCKGAASVKIDSPSMSIDNVINRLALPEGRRDELMEIFCRDYASNAWGLSQAISRVAQNEDDGDDAAVFEEAAGKLLATPSLALA